MSPAMPAPTRPDRSPLAFFAVTLALALPIWILSRFVGLIGALKVPVTDLLLAFTPMTAAAILVLHAEGPRGLGAFLSQAVAFRRLARSPWSIAVILLAPLIYVLTVALLRLAGDGGVADPPLAWLPLLVVVFFVLAIGEEAGWTGYVTDPLQARYGALGASLIIAGPWWLGHIPSILQIGGGPSDLAWWILGAVALRILMTWLYNTTGGCWLAAVVFHTLLNTGRIVAYPSVGAHYDPDYQAVGYGVAGLLAALVVVAWGPRTLTGRRPPRELTRTRRCGRGESPRRP